MATITRPNPGHRGDPLFLVDLLRSFGVETREFTGWRNRGHGDFYQIWGVMAHHTGGNNTPASLIAYGHSALWGLLSQVHLDRSGVATVTGAGIAYHAGRGSYPGIQTNNANAVVIGIEANSDGVSPWPPHMLDVYYRICAAICWYLGHSSLRTIGHKEWGQIQGKWDPGGIHMPTFRAKVQNYIDRPPFLKPEPPNEGEDMAFWEEQIPSLVDPNKKFSRKDYLGLIDYHATLSNQQSAATLQAVQALTKVVAAQSAELTLLREDVAALTADRSTPTDPTDETAGGA